MSKQKNRLRAKQLRRRRSKPVASHVPTAETQAEISAALNLQLAGNLDQARHLYIKVLKREPLNPDAWHLLGMLHFAVGENETALECVQKANELVPNHPEILANLGIIYRGHGNLKQAQELLERALTLQPQSPATRNNLGTVLLEQAEFEAAAVQFQAALKLDPTFSNAIMNLGNVWQKQGRLQDAELLYQDLLKRNPNDALILNNLGETLRNQGRWEEAAKALERSIDLAPQSVEAQINFGRTLMNLCENEKARKLFARLVEQHPRLSKPHHYLGKALYDFKDFAKAATHIELSLEFDPTDVFALCSLGFVYLDSGMADKAASCFQSALELDPAMSEAHSCLLFIMSGDVNMSQQVLFEEHQKWGVMHGNVQPLGLHQNNRDTDRRLRIGYVSGDFRSHAVASFLRPVLENHDSQFVETFCYSEVAVPDEMTAKLRSVSNNWRPTCGLSNLQVAERVMSDEIDILVDLAGHTSGNRLKAFAHRPAPVQVTWIGYPNTTGLEAIDFRLSCETQNPTDEPTYHTEEIVRMKYGSFCFTPPSNAPDVSTLPALRNGYVTFGSLHRPFKISLPVQDLWAEVLHATPGSKMIIFNTRFADESTAQLTEGLVDRGISANRFEIRNEIKGDSYLEVYNEIDIGLDVFPWAGGTTTLEALSMGVPVIAHYGDRRSARSTALIVKQVGLENLIGYSSDQYVELASSLASDIDRLTRLRSGLRETVQQTICNADRFTRDLESTFREMWVRWCNSEMSIVSP